MTGNADSLPNEVITWAVRLAISYAHVRVSLPGQTPEVALGMAIAYYVLRRGRRGATDEYDTENANVRQAAVDWLKLPGNGDLPMGIGAVEYENPAQGEEEGELQDRCSGLRQLVLPHGHDVDSWTECHNGAHR